MADHWMKVGDLLPEITATLEDGSGTPVNIYGATVEFIMRSLRGGNTVVNAEAENLDADSGGTNRGKVRYLWAEGDTDVAGGYVAEWRVTYAGGEMETFPNSGYKTVAIIENLPGIGS